VSNGGLPQILWCMFALVSPLAAGAGSAEAPALDLRTGIAPTVRAPATATAG
jgi:hypothetical protein